jgi:N-ethylmaleimide reductase
MPSKENSLKLLTPVLLGPYTLRNRIVMAPLTRMRAGAGNVPRELNAEYYRQRARAGLIISEATPVSPRGHGYHGTPGIHTREQAEGWRKVTDAVHKRGGRMFLQLWHVGRMSHPDLLPGRTLPIGPSAISADDYAYTEEGPKKHPVPRALETGEIRVLIAEFRRGAELAIDAGFDGVEVHGANGYLIEQFLADGANVRTDEYGGSVENRARFALEVVEAVAQVWGADRVGFRVSPSNHHGNIAVADRWGTYSHLIRELNRFQLAYVHLVEPRVDDSADVPNPDWRLSSQRFRPLITGATKLISAGGHNRETGEQTLVAGHADLIAYGRHFIANPDLPLRFERNAQLNAYDRSTFYGGDSRGYTDYPRLKAESSSCCA